MSKEFEEWWESEKEKMKNGEGRELYFARTVYPGDLKRAFEAGTAAGRALGRRGMKGEAADIARNGKVRFITRGIRNHLELDDVRERIASAIEAIPED